ncbi:hypothetical protein, partial [uncultured Bilophila sp.]|uniref:hypothetical protein n=1 Tax=uncultured Bilophila sp. TaxID=529385 RepID=UPI00266EAF55
SLKAAKPPERCSGGFFFGGIGKGVVRKIPIYSFRFAMCLASKTIRAGKVQGQGFDKHESL